MIYEDLPSNLCAIRDYIEKEDGEVSIEKFDYATLQKKPSVSSSLCDAAASDCNESLEEDSSCGIQVHLDRDLKFQVCREILKSSNLSCRVL